jgi:hypothetical protein
VHRIDAFTARSSRVAPSRRSCNTVTRMNPSDPTAVAIAAAIAGRHLVRFTCHGAERTVEPHTFGIDASGRATLCGWQVSGASRSGQTAGWKFFRLDECRNAHALDQQFARARPDYRRGDQAFSTIFAEL